MIQRLFVVDDVTSQDTWDNCEFTNETNIDKVTITKDSNEPYNDSGLKLVGKLVMSISILIVKLSFPIFYIQCLILDKLHECQ